MLRAKLAILGLLALALTHLLDTVDAARRGGTHDCKRSCGALNIRSPFRFKGDSPECGENELVCDNNRTILDDVDYVRINSSLYIDASPCANASFSPHLYALFSRKTLNATGFLEPCTIEVQAPRPFWFRSPNITGLSIFDIHQKFLMGYDVPWFWFPCAVRIGHAPPMCGCFMITNYDMFILSEYLYTLRMFFTHGILQQDHFFGHVDDRVLIAIRTLLGVACLIAAVLIKLRRRHLSMDDTIEEFLQMQNNLFRIKRLVAIKLLEMSKSHKQDFINEVATIGRIHHVNVTKPTDRPSISKVLEMLEGLNWARPSTQSPAQGSVFPLSLFLCIFLIRLAPRGKASHPAAMDLETNFEISRTAEFIRSRNFTRVALQFPDDLLKHSTKVVTSLRKKLGSGNKVGLFVMADTAYGSCCVDEVGASHIDADCVVHYGHTCLSPTSTLPSFCVFGKASINVSSCVEKLSSFFWTDGRPTVVLYGLEYAHAISQIKEALVEATPRAKVELQFADVMCSIINPLEDNRRSNGLLGLLGSCTNNSSGAETGTRYSLGGLIWDLPEGQRMEDYMLLWIGPDNSAFANVVLTFNGCEIVRYDATEDRLVTDVSQQKRILKRRYYLVERAKDANMVGILVGTLGIAGYLHMIHQMKELIMGAGKKAYTLVMGRPNPAKLANFPECDVFIYVSCAQTALLDSKEFLAPVITPFEAMLAFNRGSQWTGTYVMEFRDLINSSPLEVRKQPEEARFSFLKGGYVEDFELQENADEDNEGSLALANATEKVLQLRDTSPGSLVKRVAKSGAEFFVTRSYHGLEMQANSSLPEPYLVGRSGKASGYKEEKIEHET
ncbi:2-(3-amino-3-carboxypropyl)histidine synthase subunit 2 [Herrania umbratica]|uniref:2-(3-amino-3-carboxypropyl)histidine synthase subunit 2 n=1 Tax=Herrania umbratica TaxID=108875 RepID=A0A6J1AZY6_9ROSI|nr:2-(3-amino-3-carboxypropyl)histidine synthase subunit 2 [Herrania umbratica]